ncbi:MAG: hypothetical protein LQ346_002850 [Caloplaca aetnensis]|nr:MAG: hypothetical protein LQ346_002850 [Caloplaca aetnensis]
MSAPLWRAFFENEVEQFRRLLAIATFISSSNQLKGGAGAPLPQHGAAAGSPGTSLGTSPTLTPRGKRVTSGGSHGNSTAKGNKQSSTLVLTRADVNCKDPAECTLLHHIASSSSGEAHQFAAALLGIPLLDLYAQDAESGWTALHRALYFGNIAIAQSLIERDFRDVIGHAYAGANYGAIGLIKIKDREGNSPFDLYGASIASRTLPHDARIPLLPEYSDDDDHSNAFGASGDSSDEGTQAKTIRPRVCIDGDELFTFGSNKNFSLGFGDEDDRQYPERISLKRPNRLLHRLTDEHESRTHPASQHLHRQNLSSALPAVVQYMPIIVQDVRLAKFHSAVLTNDPEGNLFICGFGPGGRLGTGDETTRFGFVPVSAGGLASRRIVDIGLGQNHTVAVSSIGEVFSWGNNTYGQLGYALPNSNLRDEELTQLLPKQIYGPLKREVIRGAAASRTHTLVYTSNSLYTFGKNEGQLGLVDSDARSLSIQNTPRKVAASLFQSPIDSVSAIDKASICLLSNHDVWIFANFGYTKLSFPLDSSHGLLRNHFLATRHNAIPCHICKVASGGDTVCAMSNEGDVFTVHISPKTEAGQGNGSTTNPAKIRGALSAPQRVWTRKKGHMAVRDVDVGQDGSIIICTEAGSVWRRVKRAKVKDANAPLSTDYKPKDYKFSRVAGLTRIIAVRSNAFGAYAAIRGDCSVLQNQIHVDPQSLWNDLYPLMPLKGFALEEEDSETENPRPRFWTSSIPTSDTSTILEAVLYTPDVEEAVSKLLVTMHAPVQTSWDVHIGSTTSTVHLPVHEFILAGRSHVLSRALATFRKEYFFAIPKVLTIEYNKDGEILLLFEDVDFLTILNLVLYLYTDSVADVWLQTRRSPRMVSRYRQVRNELMQVAAHLEMRYLEQAVRVQTPPLRTLHKDLDQAVFMPAYFENGDVEIELDGASLQAHSPILCRRCPFFEGLFQGRAAGRWLDQRRQQSREITKVDLRHIDPEIFKLVRRHIYTDAGEEIFEHVRCTDLESFLDLVLEVMAVANELMLDRLSQCCQKVLGNYVNTRNVCQLLNVVSPCSVVQFKRAALEYICLNLEGMLEYHLLNELDEDLMVELDETIRQNQLTHLPVSRSGRAQAELLNAYPQLAAIMERGRRTKVDQVAFRSRWRNDDMLAKSLQVKGGISLDDEARSPALTSLKPMHKPRHDDESQGSSPFLTSAKSTADLMFQMDITEEMPVQKSEKQAVKEQSARTTPSLDPVAETPWLTTQHDNERTNIAASTSPLRLSDTDKREELGLHTHTGSRIPSMPRPWGDHAIGSQKLDMKDIMAQASSSRISSISTGLAASSSSIPLSNTSRLSQKERKKQQQRAALWTPQDTVTPPVVEAQADTPGHGSPWQIASQGAKTSLRDLLGADSSSPSSSRNITDRAASNPPLTLRQTIPGKSRGTNQTTSENIPESQHVPLQRSISTPSALPAKSTPPRLSSTRPLPSPAAIGPSSGTPAKSVRYTHPQATAEPSLQLSMADILSQQQTEKDVIKEAAAKRSLQEIQEEQAFQEWWDEESRKVREQEHAAAAAAAANRKNEGRGSRGRSRKSGESKGSTGKRKGGGAEAEEEASTGGRGEGSRGRGGARGRGRGKGRGTYV